MKKLRKIIVSLIAGACAVVCMTAPASAYYYNTKKTFDIYEGGLFGSKVFATKYTYEVYKDSSSWYAMFHGLDVCPAIYHSKGKGSTTLTYSNSISYKSTTASEFSASLGASIGVEGIFEGTAGVTGGQTYTYGYSVTASGSVGRTLSSTAKTGYYKMTMCYNFDKYRLDKYKNGSTSILCSYYPCLPKGSPYIAVLYGASTSNSSYSKY